MPQFNKTNENNNSSMQSEPSTSSSMRKDETTPITYTKSSMLPIHLEEMKRSGNDFMENEKYLQAINQYTECIKIAPNYPVFYLNRATAFMRRNFYGDMYAGLRDCQQALKLDPTYQKSAFRLARALFGLDFVTEASECLDEFKKRFPNDANNKQINLLSQEIQSQLDEVSIYNLYLYSES